jgi:molybdenum cofactor biosynthesis protein MoaC
MMRDITHKQSTLRTATAQGIVYCAAATVDMIREKTVPKGDVFEFARAAGFLGAKNTAHLIPHCHPIGIDAMDFEIEFLTEQNYSGFTGLVTYRPGIVITTKAQCIGRTGIEIEAITGVSIAALTVFDILKPLDTTLEISHIKVLAKTGGKSGRTRPDAPVTCAVLVCSDSVSRGEKEDTSGLTITRMLEEHGAEVSEFAVVSDDTAAIRQQITQWVDKDVHFIFTTGGTGLGPRDVTVEAVKELLEKDADGIPEAMRAHGQIRTPLAMMSRAVAGSIRGTTIVTLPGSVKGVTECLDAILPAVFHARQMLRGGGH